MGIPLRVAGEPDPPVVSGDARRSGRGCPSWTVCRWRPWPGEMDGPTANVAGYLTGYYYGQM